MAKRRRRPRRKRRISRKQKRDFLSSRPESLLSDSLIKRLNAEARRRQDIYRRIEDRDVYKPRRYDLERYAKRYVRSRVKPTFLYQAQDVRDYLRGRKDLICRRRKERRESLFARRNIGFGHKVNQLKNYTIDSLIQCKRR